MRKYGESITTRILMATVPHVTSGSGIRKFQADRFLFDIVYIDTFCLLALWGQKSVTNSCAHFSGMSGLAMYLCGSLQVRRRSSQFGGLFNFWPCVVTARSSRWISSCQFCKVSCPQFWNPTVQQTRGTTRSLAEYVTE